MRLLLDACVLYPTVMREVLLGAAKAGFYEPRWSDRILEEWARAARKLGPEGEAQARFEVGQVTRDFPQALVTQRTSTERLWLPDPDDIHVLASAIAGSCDGIVTMNAKDFPRNVLSEEGLYRSDPDGLLCRFFDEDPKRMADVGARVVQEAIRLSGENWTVRRLMKKARLPRLGKALEGA